MKYTLQAYNDGCSDVDLVSSCHNALGNVITSDDASKDVHKDSINLQQTYVHSSSSNMSLFVLLILAENQCFLQSGVEEVLLPLLSFDVVIGMH